MFAPKNIESQWTRLENTLSESIAQKKWYKPFLLFISIAVAYFTFNMWTQSSFPQWARFHLIQDRLWACYVLIFLSFIPLFFRSLRFSTPFLFLVVSLSWLFPIYKLNSISLHAFIPIFYLIVCTMIANFKKINPWAKTLIYVILFLGMVSIMTDNAIDSANSRILIYFSNIHLDLLLLYFIGASFNQKAFPTQFHFNPLQLVQPSPIPENSESQSDSDYEKQFVKGFLGLIVAQFIFIVLIVCLQQDAVANSQNPLVYYFVFVFMVIGAMKSTTSFLWIYGIKTISATYFLLLAKSPVEVWQRGSVFIADFLFNKIYLPIWKRSRSMTVSSASVIIAVLVHLFIFHEILVKAFLRFQFGNALFGSFGITEVLRWVLWVAVWLAWIAIFSIFSKSTKALHSLALFQWILVLLTHLGSSMIFPLVLYLSSVIRF